ncbi:hypothetical protein DUNSADRAFT_17943, partial [Dunaliella salina]
IENEYKSFMRELGGNVPKELQGEDDSSSAAQGRGRDGLSARGHHYGRDRDPIGPQPPSRAGPGPGGPPKEDDSHDACTL